MNEKTIYAKVHICHDTEDSTPEAVKVVIDDAMATKIRKYANIAKENSLYAVEVFDYSATWLDEMPTDTIGGCDAEFVDDTIAVPTLLVNATSFWYQACLSEQGTVFESNPISLTELPEETQEILGDGPQEFEVCFTWQMTGAYRVRAASKKDAICFIVDRGFTAQTMPRNTQFVEDSTDFDVIDA